MNREPQAQQIERVLIEGNLSTLKTMDRSILRAIDMLEEIERLKK